MSVNSRDYEAILIVSPDLNEEAVSAVRTQLTDLAVRHKGKLLESAVLGKRKLSYPMGRRNEGLYLQLRLQLPSLEVVAFEKTVRMTEGVLRFMVTHPCTPAPAPAAATTAAPAAVVSQQTRE